MLAPTVADWAQCISSNSLWMDCRVAARKALFSSLPLLVEKASLLLRQSIPLSDCHLQLHLLANRQHVSSGPDTETEQVFSYLCETVTACIAALCADSPGLDPYAVSCLLRSLRFCKVRPPCSMMHAEDAMSRLDGSGAINSNNNINTACSDDEKQGTKNTLHTKLVKAMAECSLRHKNIPSREEERVTNGDDDHDDVRSSSSSLMRSPVFTSDLGITTDVPHSSSRHTHDFPLPQGNRNSDIMVSEERDQTIDDFSDWDEEEEEEEEGEGNGGEVAEVRSEGRQGSFSFCISSDVAAMVEEIALLEYMVT